MKDMSAKKIVMCCLAFAISLMMLLSLCFDLVRYDMMGITLGDNGFDLLDFKSEFIVDERRYGWGAIVIGVLAYVQMFAAIAGMVLSIVSLFAFNLRQAETACHAFVINGLIFSVLYMLEGIIFYTLYKDTMELPSSSMFLTLAYVPLILHAVLTVAYFLCVYLVPSRTFGHNAVASIADAAPVGGYTGTVGANGAFYGENPYAGGQSAQQGEYMRNGPVVSQNAFEPQPRPMTQYSDPRKAPVSAETSFSIEREQMICDVLAKYKELLDGGLITQEDYDRKKEALLK